MAELFLKEIQKPTNLFLTSFPYPERKDLLWQGALYPNESYIYNITQINGATNHFLTWGSVNKRPLYLSVSLRGSFARFLRSEISLHFVKSENVQFLLPWIWTNPEYIHTFIRLSWYTRRGRLEVDFFATPTPKYLSPRPEIWQ